MTVELKVPSVGESITEVEVGEWLKGEGDYVQQDENVVSLESEKATVELPAPTTGTLARILKRKGEKAAVGEAIGYVEAVIAMREERPPTPAPPPQPAAEAPRKLAAKTRSQPAAQRVAPEGIKAPEKAEAAKPQPAAGEREEEAVRMTPLRRAVAERLVEAQRTMAMLTTFNEIDLTEVQALRQEFQESFTRKFGIKLGLMPFFIKAAIEALKRTPQLNASVRGSDIIYHKIGRAHV